ncbi:MAG: class I SAM-dependent methyltransferase [Egibacteraceae bacterium]
MSRRRPAERLVWAIDTLALQPDDRILEIGCGHGVAVSLVCERLAGGHVTAIDRSPKMIAMASERNAAHIDAGLASLHTASLHEADFGNERFDKILAIHVPVFARGEPTRELAIVKDHLAPGGTFHLVNEPLVPDETEPMASALAEVLAANGFTIIDILVADLSATRVCGVIAAGQQDDQEGGLPAANALGDPVTTATSWRYRPSRH